MSASRRICISAAGANAGGAVTYLINLLSEYSQNDTGDRYLVIAPQETLDLLSESLQSPFIEAFTYPHPPVRQLRRMAFDQFQVSRLARAFSADVLFSANGFGTYKSPCPEALLIRNALYFSELLEKKMESIQHSTRAIHLRRLWSRLSIRGADSVLFPTDAMKTRVNGFVSIQDAKQTVIPYGFDHPRFFAGDPVDENTLLPIRQWQENGRKALLYVAGYAIHKNFETAIEGLARLLQQGVDAGLVLTAVRAEWGDMREFDALLERIRELGIEDHISMTGAVPWTRLHSLYAACDLFLFPSFLESFGHPMIEAMASGLPTVAADTAVNREILGDAALFFSAFDPEALARRVREALEDPGALNRLKESGLERSALFSWPEHAQRLRASLCALADRESTGR